MSKYADYEKKLANVKDPDTRLVVEILLDLRYVLNSLDKIAKELTGRRPKRSSERTEKSNDTQDKR